MLGLLYSHVDPPNSLVCVCLCLLSEGQRIRTPYTCSTQLAGYSSGAPHSCQRARPARFIIVSEFFKFLACEGKTWCWRSEWQAALPYGNSNWTLPYSWTDLNSGTVHWFLQDIEEDSQCTLFKSHTAVFVEHCKLCKQGLNTLGCRDVSLFRFQRLFLQ